MDRYGVYILRLFITFFIFTSLVFSSSFEIEKKLYTLIVFSIFPQKTMIKIWTDEPRKKEILLHVKNIQIVNDPESADLIIVKSTHLPKTSALVFVSDYNLLNKYKDRAIGGFYWQKGRPNLLFLSKNLQAFHIELSKNMQEYIEDSL